MMYFIGVRRMEIKLYPMHIGVSEMYRSTDIDHFCCKIANVYSSIFVESLIRVLLSKIFIKYASLL